MREIDFLLYFAPFFDPIQKIDVDDNNNAALNEF